jgi:hypothetical protein
MKCSGLRGWLVAENQPGEIRGDFMGVREFFAFEAADFGFFGKYQRLLGILLILIGLGVVVFPGLLEIMVATAVVLVGLNVVGSALRLRRLHHRQRDFALGETVQW